jgi:hypothetical protein
MATLAAIRSSGGAGIVRKKRPAENATPAPLACE